jgi:hypothetical protein
MQHSAAGFAQPILKVFGPNLFRMREKVDMPLPGEVRAARFEVTHRDLAWDRIYSPLAAGVGWTADRLNKLQFLTIRRYLGLVFAALVILLAGLTLWS